MSTTTHNKVKSKSHSITVSKNFKPNQGQEIGSKYVLGEKLGEGMYGAVYDIITQQQQLNDDNSVGLVFKCLKVGQQSEKHGLLREWLINEKLNQLDHSEGFMYAEVGVYREDGKFIGMILEKMNGWTVRKRIKQKKFHDIDYICFMLQDVFEALQQSQIQLGFHHADLHLGNIMEQHPCTPNTILNRSKSKKWTITGLSYDVNLNKIDAYDLQNVRFKMIDFGHSWFFNRKNQELAEITQKQKPSQQQQQYLQEQLQYQQYQQLKQQQQVFEQSEKKSMINQSQKQKSTEIYIEQKQQQQQQQKLKEKQEIQVFFSENLYQQLQYLQFQNMQEIFFDDLCQQLKTEQYQNTNQQQSINQENQLIHKQQKFQEEFQQQTGIQFQTPFENPDQEFQIWNESSEKNIYNKQDFLQIFVISKSIIQTHEKNFLYIQQKRCVTYFQIPENQNLIIMVVQNKNYSSQDEKKLFDENNIKENLTEKLMNFQQEFLEISEKENQKQYCLQQNFAIDSIEQIMQKIFQKSPQNLNSNNETQQNQNTNSEIQNNLSSGFSNRKKFEFPSQQFEFSNAEMHGQLDLELMHSEQPNSNSAILLRTSCTEKVYRIFWRGKGDVYRILLSLAAQIDCNIWDKKDQQLVEGVRKLIYCVLGIKIQRKYEENLDQKLRGFGEFSLKNSKFQTGWYRWGRRLRIRTHALLIPSRAGILAKDALALWQQIQTQITLQPGEK